ncbi:unnamed protein product, partial [Meganyctiphanes norvegica]
GGGSPRPRHRAAAYYSRSLPRLSSLTSSAHQSFHSINTEEYFDYTYKSDQPFRERHGEGSRSLPIFKHYRELKSLSGLRSEDFREELRSSTAPSHYDEKSSKSSPYAQIAEKLSSKLVPPDSLCLKTKIKDVYESWTSPSKREECDSTSDILPLSSQEHQSVIAKGDTITMPAVSSTSAVSIHPKPSFQQRIEKDKKEKKYRISENLHILQDLCDRIPTTTRRKTRDPKNWEFLMRLLADSRTNPWIIRWENEAKATFKLIQPDVIVQLWNSRSTKPHVIYEAFARGLRYHYRSGALFLVAEQQMVYGCGPKALEYYKELAKSTQKEK